MTTDKNQRHIHASWIPLGTSIKLIFTRKRLFLWSALLICLTIFLTALGDWLLISYADELQARLLPAEPLASGIWGWIKHAAWAAGSWFFLVVSRVVSFYLSFLLAYTLTTPGYGFLSAAAEKMYAGEFFDEDAAFSIGGMLRDMLEGLKIALFGVVITIAAIFLNFIPVIGQIATFLLYCYYSAMMFFDYPASRRRWHLGKKISWIRQHSGPALRIGIGPALISMIPLINIFVMALFFPILTVHASLNFSAIEIARKRQEQGNP